MFDWPVASVLLGTLMTLVVAMMKLKPANGNGKVKASDIVDWREYEDFRAEMRTRMSSLETGMTDIQGTVKCILSKVTNSSES